MNNVASQRWASDGKIPYDRCFEDIHVFTAGPRVCSGVICQCGKTKWIYVKCEHCGQVRGQAILIPKTQEMT